MSGVIHKFVDNSYGIGHSDESCVCVPTVSRKAKASTSGRKGQHQGYRYETNVVHNELPSR